MKRKFEVGVVCFLGISHVCLLSVLVCKHSPTLNEPAHLLAGIAYWEFSDFDFYGVNPPLVRFVAAAPVIASGYTYDWRSQREGLRPEFEMGVDFVTSNGRETLRLITQARIACIPFSVLGMLTCWLWSRDINGSLSGLLSAALWAFSPTVLGHASLIVPDAHAAAIAVAASYIHWKCLVKSNLWLAIAAGLALGAALLSKTTNMLLVPCWIVSWAIYRCFGSGHDSAFLRREAAMLLLTLLIALATLNLGYGCRDSFIAAGDFEFVSETFAGAHQDKRQTGNIFAESLIGGLPIPLPGAFVRGVDMQQRDFEGMTRPSYLRGEYRNWGWKYYYAYAVLVKTPVGTLLLGILALVATLTSRSLRNELASYVFVIIPPLVVFSVVSFKSGFNHHSRYIFTCIPFVFIWMGIVFSDRGERRTSRFLGCSVRPQAMTLLASLFFCLTLLASLWHFPNSMSFFNLLSGGPANGPRHLLDSNIDWGQDFLNLELWRDQVGNEMPVFLAYYGGLHPQDFGNPKVKAWPFSRRQVSAGERVIVADGYYAISVNVLYGLRWVLRGDEGNRYLIDRRPLEYLREARPIGLAGYSIRIFSAEQMRIAYHNAFESANIQQTQPTHSAEPFDYSQ